MTIANATKRLQDYLGERFSTQPAILQQHSQDESYFPVIQPDGVTFPNDTSEVAKIVAICAEEVCPIIPWGVGTSLEGHALALEGGITMNFANMKQVLGIHSDDLCVVVQPGITREELNHELRNTGLFFPIDPGANATIGGMTATSASGTTAVKYGTMRDNVKAMEIVCADGHIIRTGNRAKKSSAGYDLNALFIGSEGTLGLITEITLKLSGIPDKIAAATCCFNDIDSAVNAVISIIQLGIPIARVELLDSIMIQGLNLWDKTFDLPELPHLFLEFHGSQLHVNEQAEETKEIIAEFGGRNFKWATHVEDRNFLWRGRHNSYYAAKALRPGCKVLTTDSCVPISKLAEAINETTQEIERSPLRGPIVGHVGDGNFHATLLIDPDSTEELEIAKQISYRINELSVRLGGTITGEHGIGAGKLDYMPLEHGSAWQTMQLIKKALDPKNIFNPGKVVQIA
ncbi:MAG: FAD-binding protein [Rhodobacteraceae bacterium]|nr:FAD-binding protein [Paracoccaceae bacterium]